MPAPRNDKKAETMLALYRDGYSLAEVGKAFGVSRQSVYAMFRRRKYRLRAKKTLPFIMWLGRKYTLHDGYYRRTSGRKERLHRDVWRHHFGPIPRGMQVHHKNGDRRDNRPCNLECLTPEEHGRKHGFASNQHAYVSDTRPVR